MPGAGEPNPLCDKAERRPEDKTENARSIGVLMHARQVPLLDLADLTWNKELDLMCPNTKVAPVDVYLVTHHGMNMSGLGGHRACAEAAGGHHEQRRAQGRHAGSLAGDP